MELKRKLPWIITGKSLLAVGSIAMVALALVTYTATINISFNAFFVQGMSTTNWSMTTSSGTRYLPGKDVAGTLTPLTPSASNTSTFAFYSQTGQGYIKVNPGTLAPTSDFSSFKIFVLTWNATTWNNATLYTTSTFSAVLSGGIDGTSAAAAGYLHVNSATQVFYAIQVNYILTGTPSGTPQVTFQYTPSLN